MINKKSAPHKPGKYFSGLTALEILVVVAIMTVFAVGVLVMLGDFGGRRDVESAIQKIYYDWGLAWKYARTLRNGYEYYGIRFYNNTSSDGEHDGYKILHFHANGNVSAAPILPINGTTAFEVIKSSQTADNPEVFENTFFPDNVIINPSSELKAGDTVVFGPQGSATRDGINLLNATQDALTLSKGNLNQTLRISNLTGYIEIVK